MDFGDRPVSRRALLGGGGLVAAGAVAGGSLWYERTGQASTLTVAQWQAERGAHYFIAHRGAGDVLPEHTLPAYEAALRWGAQAIEISTSATSDGVLICMHDLTYDRTTNGKGVIADQPSSVLTNIGVTQPQLGPKWARAPLTPIPRLDDVLRRLGARAVLCIEAKRDLDYDALVAMIDKHRLQRSVVIKLFHTSSKIAQAKAAGYPLFVYLGSSDLSSKTINSVAAGLDRARDCLVIPTTDRTGPVTDATVRTAVDTAIPTWVYPVHRRVEADRFFGLGVAGVITSSVGYSRQRIAPARSDDWASGAITAGQLSRDPSAPVFAPTWRTDGALTLAGHSIGQHFLCLGQLGKIGSDRARYTIQFDARWDQLPTDREANLSLAFGHADDSYYQHRLGLTAGYHAIQRATGSLELYRHVAGSTVGIQLASPVPTTAPAEGVWTHFTLQVDPTSITWRLGDNPTQSIVVDDDGSHGSHLGYVHIGRSSDDGALSFRGLRVS